jgi:asparagine synthase (glutamine-hydrolysing)
MCGIAGIIHPSASHPLIEAMTDMMVSRGPDGAGFHVEPGVAMGMRRLSIIDLAHGWQPLRSSDNQVIAFQNGEIYNHRQLREQLQALGYAFATDSDTEVIAHGYHVWGATELARRLDGMYAIAILDRRRRVLCLIRDRLGEKPLFFLRADGGLAYASDLRILASLPMCEPAPCVAALDDYLALHYVAGRKTILEGIQRVLPGEILEVPLDGGQPILQTYYQVPVGREEGVSDDALASLVEEAVASRLIADVPVGVFLSGGLDSSIIAAIAARHQKGIATFSMGFRSARHDESEYARYLAAQIGSQHHHFVFDERNFAELLPLVARALDEPVGDQALLPVYWLCQEASQHVKVVLSGEGADEVFAGYGYYGAFAEAPSLRQRLRELLRRRASSPKVSSLHRSAHGMTPSGFPLLTDAAGRAALGIPVPTTVDAWEAGLMARLDETTDPLQRATTADLLTWLPDDLLVKFDRMAMAHSLEGRAPFLDPRVVAAGNVRLRSSDRMRGDVSKVALRRVARRWLPEKIFERRKQGFVLPMRGWIAQWIADHRDVEAFFADIPRFGPALAGIGQMLKDSVERDPGRERFHFAAILLGEWALAFESRLTQDRDRLLACSRAGARP